MTQAIEDYAMIGDTETAALVGRDGSIDWLCLPRFDSGSCFAKLIGEKKHGRWLIVADGSVTSHVRRYRNNSMVLETEITTDSGIVQVIDFMPPRHHHPRVVRIVRGVDGEVDMRTELVMRFEYGYDIPWVRRTERGLSAIAGPNALVLDSPIDLEGIKMRHEGKFKSVPGTKWRLCSPGTGPTRSPLSNLIPHGHSMRRSSFGGIGVPKFCRCTANGMIWHCVRSLL